MSLCGLNIYVRNQGNVQLTLTMYCDNHAAIQIALDPVIHSSKPILFHQMGQLMSTPRSTHYAAVHFLISS